jgi:hypothetical protein
MAKLLKETGPRVNLVANLSSIDDFEVLYTDFTEILYRRGRAKAQLMPIIDHSSKLVVGHALGDADNTELALESWRSAKKTLQRYGQQTEGLVVHHDQDGVYLGHGWLYELAVRDKVRVSYSETGANGNVHMEAELFRDPIAQGQMDVKPIIIFADCRSPFFKGAKIIPPKDLFLDRPDDPFGLGVPFRVVVRKEDLIDGQQGRVRRERNQGWLRVVVRNKVQPLVPHSRRKFLTERLSRGNENRLTPFFWGYIKNHKKLPQKLALW